MSRARYIWDRAKAAWVPIDRYMRSHVRGPTLIRDIPAYKSPLGTGIIDGRAARREDLKRHNCREVDPSEFKPRYINERFARKYGLPYNGN